METQSREDREDGLGRLLSRAFHGGEVRRRELRLTPEEARRAAGEFGARVRPIGRDWYEITFGGMEV